MTQTKPLILISSLILSFFAAVFLFHIPTAYGITFNCKGGFEKLADQKNIEASNARSERNGLAASGASDKQIESADKAYKAKVKESGDLYRQARGYAPDRKKADRALAGQEAAELTTAYVNACLKKLNEDLKKSCNDLKDAKQKAENKKAAKKMKCAKGERVVTTCNFVGNQSGVSDDFAGDDIGDGNALNITGSCNASSRGSPSGKINCKLSSRGAKAMKKGSRCEPIACESKCVAPPPPSAPPAFDICPNIDGVQVSAEDVPTGFILINGECRKDVCLNLAGAQEFVPPGFTLDAAGNCTRALVPIPPPRLEAPTRPPQPTPFIPTGGGGLDFFGGSFGPSGGFVPGGVRMPSTGVYGGGGGDTIRGAGVGGRR